MEKAEKLTKLIVSSIIDEDVNIISESKEEAVYITVEVPENKIAKVIGKNGMIAESIRTIIRGLKDTRKKIFVRFNSI